MKQLTWLAISSWVFFFSVAEATPDPRIKLSQDAFDRYLKMSVGLFSTGGERLYKGQMRVTNLKTGNEVWNGDVIGMAHGTHMVVESSTLDAARKRGLMVVDLFKPSWRSPLAETLLRFQILGHIGNHGRAELGDTSAFQEIDVDVDKTTGTMTLQKLTTRKPLHTDFGSYDDHSFEGSLAIVNPTTITLKDMVSAPVSTFSGEPLNHIAQQYAVGNLVLVGDHGKLAGRFVTTVSYAQALQIDPTVRRCIDPCGIEIPYFFEYRGDATISGDLKNIKSETSNFGVLKCR